MKPVHKRTIHHKQEGKTYSFEVPEGEYILRNFESKDENGEIIGDTPIHVQMIENAVKILV